MVAERRKRATDHSVDTLGNVHEERMTRDPRLGRTRRDADADPFAPRETEPGCKRAHQIGPAMIVNHEFRAAQSGNYATSLAATHCCVSITLGQLNEPFTWR